MTETEWLIAVGRQLIDPIRCEEITKLLEQQIAETEIQLVELKRKLAVVQKFYPPPVVMPEGDLPVEELHELLQDTLVQDALPQNSPQPLSPATPPPGEVIDQPVSLRRKAPNAQQVEERACRLAVYLHQAGEPVPLRNLCKVFPDKKTTLHSALKRCPWFASQEEGYTLTDLGHTEGLTLAAKLGLLEAIAGAESNSARQGESPCTAEWLQ